MGIGGVREAIRIRTSLRRYGTRVLGGFAHPEAAGRQVAIGSDPIRVLMVGGGLSLGYGVTRRADALEGHLARLLAERLGRGVIVQNTSHREMPMRRSVQNLGNVGAHTYRIAIWTPSYLEALDRTSVSSWRRELTHVIDQIRATEQTNLVLLGLPPVEGRHPMVLIARPWGIRINRMIQDVARQTPHAVAVNPPPIRVSDANRWFDATYYRRTAESIVPAIATLLGAAAPAAAAKQGNESPL